jgi:hypothetical protein
MSCESMPYSQLFQSYGILNSRFILLAASDIQQCSFSRLYIVYCIHTSCILWKSRGLVTAGVNSRDNHDQSIGQGTAHSGTRSRVDWNVGCAVRLELHLLSCSLSFSLSLFIQLGDKELANARNAWRNS